MSKFDNDEAPMTQQEMQEALAINEDEILKALTGQAQYENRTETVEVSFGNAKYAFRIRPLSEKEWDKCRERNTKYSKNRRLGGIRVPESTDTTGYHSDLIYTATVDEDRAKLWDNKVFWNATGALTGRDMVDKLIPYAGKKQAVIERIEALSGYNDEDQEQYEEAVKN